MPALNFLARLLISLLFIVSGIRKILFFDATLEKIGDAGFPAPWFILIGAVAIEFLGAILLTWNVRIEWVTPILIAYVAAATLVFHVQNISGPGQLVHTMKNVAIVGGLLSVYSRGLETAPPVPPSPPEESTEEGPSDGKAQAGSPPWERPV